MVWEGSKSCEKVREHVKTIRNGINFDQNCVVPLNSSSSQLGSLVNAGAKQKFQNC